MFCDAQQSSTLAAMFFDPVRASLSSRSPANLECRRWSTYAILHRTPSWHSQSNLREFISSSEDDGTSHTAEVTASSLFEAVAQGLAALRKNEWWKVSKNSSG